MDRFDAPSHTLRNSIVTLVFIGLLATGWAWLRGGTPRIRGAWPSALGLHATLRFHISDSMGVRRVTAVYLQHGKKLPVADLRLRKARRWWLAPRQQTVAVAMAAGRADVHGLEDGPAQLVIRAEADNLRGTKARLQLPIVIRSLPPRLRALTYQQYVVEGGCEMLVYRQSAGVVRSGVEMGGQFFAGHPLPGARPGTWFCLFSDPWNDTGKTPPVLTATDDAGNTTTIHFPVEVFPRKFRQRPPFNLTHAMLAQMVPPILAHEPGLTPAGNLAADFTLIDTKLAAKQQKFLAALSQHSQPKFFWHGAFMPLPHAAVEARFGDYRAFMYHGRLLDHETHLGVDMASVRNTPVPAGNAGRVLWAGYFGIYGNAVILDHGFGLMSLYGHMKNFSVHVGEMVQKGQMLGHSDSTGLALGDHVHYSILLDGVQVNPEDWWDPNWIQAHIWHKLARFGNRQTEGKTGRSMAAKK